MTSAPVAIHIPKREVQRRSLENGSALLYAPNPYNQIVAVRILSRTGSKYEPAPEAGRVNLAMRMLSAGTSQWSEDEIADRLEGNGAHFKAEAGKDWSSIDLLTTTPVLKEDLQTVLTLLDDSQFPEDKLARERELVRMNILEDDDSPLTYTMRRFSEFYYGSHPYAWPSLGKVETLDAISRDDIASDGRRALESGQLVVSVVGGSENSDVLSIVEEAFSQRTADRSETPPSEISPGVLSENKDCFVRRETESDYVVLGYPGCSLNQRESLTLRLIASILGGSMDSRLFREIREKRGLCYQVGAAYTPRMEHSPLLVYTVTTPKNREEALRCAEAEIERLKVELVADEELHRAKTYICGSYVMSMESNMGQAGRYGAYEIAGLGWEYANAFPDDIQSVTAETIRETAERLFTHRLLTVATSNAQE
ncbi:MAG: pitrilysin family protein [Candidatus Hinthialibacter antarcticus]|nr:pitrilysin family protein [Candidatus Hinthialibacter antarcticus]